MSITRPKNALKHSRRILGVGLVVVEALADVFLITFAPNHSFSCDICLSFQLRLSAEAVQIILARAQQVSAAI